jgi:hypothetical protein
MADIEEIRKGLLEADCPHIEADEDVEQIRTLLAEESDHKQILKNWILEQLSDDPSDSSLKSLGLDFSGKSALKNWKMAVKLLKAKKIHSEAGLKEARHYLDFLSSQ